MLFVNAVSVYHLEWMYRHLFNDSGVKPIRGHGKNYYKDDFAERYFPSGWHIVHDHLGDGCEVDFPIRLHEMVISCLSQK